MNLLQELLLMSAETLPSGQELDLSDLLLEENSSPVALGHAGDRLLPVLSPGLQKVSHTHHAIMDYMIANPSVPLKAVAEHFGYTQAWLSTVINSDVFRHAFRERRENWELVHDTKLVSKLHEVATRSLDGLLDILNDKDERPSPSATNEIAKTALSALGFTSKKAAAPTVQVNQQFISQQDLADAHRILHGTAN